LSRFQSWGGGHGRNVGEGGPANESRWDAEGRSSGGLDVVARHRGSSRMAPPTPSIPENERGVHASGSRSAAKKFIPRLAGRGNSGSRFLCWEFRGPSPEHHSERAGRNGSGIQPRRPRVFTNRAAHESDGLGRLLNGKGGLGVTRLFFLEPRLGRTTRK